LVAEVRRLLDEGVPAKLKRARRARIPEGGEFLSGKRDVDSAIEQTKLNVRHYAKRQLSWFRHEPDVNWVEGFVMIQRHKSKPSRWCKRWLNSTSGVRLRHSWHVSTSFLRGQYSDDPVLLNLAVRLDGHHTHATVRLSGNLNLT